MEIIVALVVIGAFLEFLDDEGPKIYSFLKRKFWIEQDITGKIFYSFLFIMGIGQVIHLMND